MHIQFFFNYSWLNLWMTGQLHTDDLIKICKCLLKMLGKVCAVVQMGCGQKLERGTLPRPWLE